MTPFADQIDPSIRLASIPENATFDDWRIVKDLIERSMLPIELRGIDNMGFDDLQWYSVTTMHQVLCLFFGLPFGFFSIPLLFVIFMQMFHFLVILLGHVYRMEINRSLHQKAKSNPRRHAHRLMRPGRRPIS